MKFTELFSLLNARLLNQNNKVTKTIISTNLNLNELSARYGERIISRFIGNYNIYRLDVLCSSKIPTYRYFSIIQALTPCQIKRGT